MAISVKKWRKVETNGEKWRKVARCGYMWEIVGKVEKVGKVGKSGTMGIVTKSGEKWRTEGKSGKK